MTFQLKMLKILKEKLDKSLMTPAEKYWFLAGALEFIFEENHMNLEAEIDKVLVNEPNSSSWDNNIDRPPSKNTTIETKPKDHPPFAPQILKPEPCKKPKKYSVDSCKVMIMNTLPYGTMSVNEMIKYNRIELDCNIYQMMITAANLLSYDHKIIKKQKTGVRGLQYEYSLPSDMPTKIVLNGDLVEQQRRV
jgi:hypothetical protein